MRIISLYLAVLWLSGCAGGYLKPISENESFQLADNEGLLLIKIEDSRALSSIEIAGDNRYLIRWKELQQAIRYITPYHNRSNYFLIPMKTGSYQFKKIKRFTHTHKYWVDLTNDDAPLLWSFRIEPGKLNYIGDFATRLNRSGNFSRIYLANRSSMAMAFAQNKLPQIIEEYPITYSGPGRDDVFEVLNR